MSKAVNLTKSQLQSLLRLYPKILNCPSGHPRAAHGYRDSADRIRCRRCDVEKTTAYRSRRKK